MLPRCSYLTSGQASRTNSVTAATSLARRLLPTLATHHCYLAADFKSPRIPTRVIVCTGVVDEFPTVPGYTWLPVLDLADTPDYFAATCGAAASQSFCPSPIQPPKTPTCDSTAPADVPLIIPAIVDKHSEWTAARDAMNLSNARLVTALMACNDPYVQSWANVVGQRDGAVLDATPPELRQYDPHIRDRRFAVHLFVPRVQAPNTMPFKYPTNPSPPVDFAPRSIADLLEPAAHILLDDWLRRVFPFIVSCLRYGPQAERHASDTLVIPQSMFTPEARGIIWDLRGQTPVPACFHQPITSHLNLTSLTKLLADYPDQELLSFMQFGTASKSSAAGLDIVLSPHLVSLRLGFGDVDAAIRKLQRIGWCSIFDHIPFVPARAIPRGTVPQGDGHRVITDGGAPRKVTKPPSMSLNAASRLSFWPKEVKPTLADAANDLAVLRHIALELNDDVYILADDYKSFFNQFRTHPSEWWKSLMLWVSDADPGSLPVWVVEYVLGFGLTPSSNIAQRFANAMLWILQQRVDADEVLLFEREQNPVLLSILATRRALGPDQARLWSGFVYTDDSHFLVIGAARMVRVLAHWGNLTKEVNTLMAGESKRQLGNCIKWNGAYFNAHLAHTIIPPEKALRALIEIGRIARGDDYMFRDYQSLFGFINHFRTLLRARKATLYGLSSPLSHIKSDPLVRPLTMRHTHPEGFITATSDLLASLDEWATTLRDRPGVSCATGIGHLQFTADPTINRDLLRCFFVYTDAAKEGAAVACFGGWWHGYYFSLPIPLDLLGHPIPQLEFLAIIAAQLTCLPLVTGTRTMLVTDSETSFNVLNNDGAHHPQMQHLHREYLSAGKRVFDGHRHVYGDGNPFADLASRGRIDELRELAAQHGIRARELPVPPEFLSILQRFRRRFGPCHFAENSNGQRARRVLEKNSLALAQACTAANKSGHMGTTLATSADLNKLRHFRPAPDTPGIPPRHSPISATSIATSSTRPLITVTQQTTVVASLKSALTHQYRLGATPHPIGVPTRSLTQRPLLPPPILSRPKATAPTILVAPAQTRGQPFFVSHLHDRQLPAQLSYQSTSLFTSQSFITEPKPVKASRRTSNVIEVFTRVASSLAQRSQVATPQQRKLDGIRASMHRSVGPSTCDTSPYAFDFRNTALAHVFEKICSFTDASIPTGTLLKDNLGWRRWCAYCSELNTDPWRMDVAAHMGLDPIGFDRESRLLCGFLIHSHELIGHGCKPASAYAMVSAVRRVHRRKNVQMVPSLQLSAVFRGMSLAYIAENGHDSILKDRMEPISPPLLRRIFAVAAGTKLGNKLLDWNDIFFLCLGTSFAVAMSTGFRKAEALLPDAAEHNFNRLCVSHLAWEIDGKIYADPSDVLLQGMIPHRDKAILRPPPSKADQTGELFGHNLIYLPLDPVDPANAAHWLRRLAIALPRHGPKYRHWPLFVSDRTGSPLRHSPADTYLRHLLCAIMPLNEAKKYSFHSFRIGFASSLLAAGASYDMIQALARWRSVESVLIYARLNPDDYAAWVTRAMLQTTTSTTTRNLPVIDDHNLYATLHEATSHLQDFGESHDANVDIA